MFFNKKKKEVTQEETTPENTTSYYIHLVETLFNSVKFDSKELLFLNEKNRIGWFFPRGSTLTQIILDFDEESQYIKIFCPLVYLPQHKILPLYRRCLELNYRLNNCSLCVIDDIVALIAQRPLQGLDQDELNSMVFYLSGVADNLDNQLAEEFNALIVTEENR